MNILLLGSGGREHALAWKLAKSPLLNTLYIAPGNGGTQELGTNVSLDIEDFDAIEQFSIENNIEMIVVGPEAPLVKGIKDYFKNSNKSNVSVIGPDKNASQLEGSKDFAKNFMMKYGVPTAKYQSFTNDTLNEANAFLDSLNGPYVLKADGLAAGKGVLILNNIEEAKAELQNMFSGKFGDAGNTVVIEEFLNGIEVSVFVLTDGANYVILPEAKDYKRIGEGDTGLNTGGMGAVSPVPFASKEFINTVDNTIVKPTLEGIKQEGMDYSGFIFLGLMVDNGIPKVIEYNVRMGDPETEVVIPRIKNDLLEMFKSCSDQSLANHTIECISEYAVTVMQVAGGYPESYKKGNDISIQSHDSNELIFHAGTKISDNQLITNGGRVISCTAFGNSLNQARVNAQNLSSKISFNGKYFRSDIGKDLL